MDRLQPSSAWVYGRFPSRRSVVYGTKGMVACSQPLAAEAGMEILRNGGNAGTWQALGAFFFNLTGMITADAAIAVSAALNGTIVFL